MTHEPVHKMFRRTARRLAEHPAIEWEDGRQLSYRELDARSDGIAAALCRTGAAPGSPVAVLSPDSGEVITALLGVLKAGGAFVPLDLDYPTARIETVVAEVEPRWWLVGEAYAEAAGQLRQSCGLEPALIPLSGQPEAGAAEPPAVEVAPDALCYIYFTSGSTGRPKGIMGRLKAIDHFVRWEAELVGAGEGIRVSQLTSPAFDAFLRDAFLPLTVGGTVCVPSGRETILEGGRLADWLNDKGIHLVHCTPSLFRSLLSQELSADRLPALRHVLLAGEPVLPADVHRWYEIFGERVELVNLYGPSETTMTKLFHRVRREDGGARSVPIGKPIPGARAIVVDDAGKPCPPNRLGEIYIRTPFRALGYWRQPELTAEAFVQNPFNDRGDDVVYRTGDLGRVREDGDFEFVGRRDQQVKVRGVRIELAPLESLLHTHEQVSEAVVVDRLDTQGNKFLCAYVVLDGEVETRELRRFLAERLPEPMVPSVFVVMEALPHTLSGKIDRRSLPDPGRMAGQMGRQYVAPRTPVEETIAETFRELLGVPKVGVHDDFFQLGGHSLLATLLLSRLRSAFAVEVPLRELFDQPTVEGLALAVTRLEAEAESPEDLSALIREIESLSEDALEALLEDGGAEAARAEDGP